MIKRKVYKKIIEAASDMRKEERKIRRACFVPDTIIKIRIIFTENAK